jgi:DNA repair protein RecO (recombination protein O)
MRTIRLTDTSLIVHWFSEIEGLIKTVAKGALRPKSPFAGKLDLFFSGEIEVVMSRKSDLHTLREVSISDWRQGLRRSYPTTLMAGYFCQLVEAGLEPHHADERVYDLLRRGLDFLDREDGSLRALYHFEKQFAQALGISDGGGDAEGMLREHLGALPASRRMIVESLRIEKD